MYMQDRIHEHAEEFLDLMASDDVIFYFCGLKRMYTSVLDMLEVSLQAAQTLIRHKKFSCRAFWCNALTREGSTSILDSDQQLLI